VIALLRAFRANTSRCTPYSSGEAVPLVDEAGGPAAMARNRRVEIFISPSAPDVQQPTVTDDASDPSVADDGDHTYDSATGNRCHITRGEAELYRRLVIAERDMWSLLEAKGLATGRPVLGFSDTSAHPDETDWKVACEGNGVPRAWCEYLYESLYFPVDGNMLRKLNDLTAEAQMYQDKLDSGTCAPSESFPSPPRMIKVAPKDPMPGDRDPKGRMY
jgi:hypothetical protein